MPFQYLNSRDEFSKELNKALNDESRLDDLLDDIIFAEQEVLVNYF